MADQAGLALEIKDFWFFSSEKNILQEGKVPMKITDTRDALDVSSSDLSGSQFSNVKLSKAVFGNVDLSACRLENVNLAGAVIRDANLKDVSISQASMFGMRIDGVLVTDLFAAFREVAARG